MKHRFLFFSIAVAAIALLLFGARTTRKKREQQKREAAYKLDLRSYAAALQPGMTRKEVEDYLRKRQIGFRQMCCADIKDLTNAKHIYDDLVKIGQEDPPFACNEKNIYIAFQFTRPGNPSNPEDWANDSDKLKAISIFRWLEGCL